MSDYIPRFDSETSNSTAHPHDDPLVDGITIDVTGFALVDLTNHKIICTAPTREKLDRLAAEELKRRMPGETAMVQLHSIKVRYA